MTLEELLNGKVTALEKLVIAQEVTIQALQSNSLKYERLVAAMENLDRSRVVAIEQKDSHLAQRAQYIAMLEVQLKDAIELARSMSEQIKDAV